MLFRSCTAVAPASVSYCKHGSAKNSCGECKQPEDCGSAAGDWSSCWAAKDEQCPKLEASTCDTSFECCNKDASFCKTMDKHAFCDPDVSAKQLFPGKVGFAILGASGLGPRRGCRQKEADGDQKMAGIRSVVHAGSPGVGTPIRPLDRPARPPDSIEIGLEWRGMGSSVRV